METLQVTILKISLSDKTFAKNIFRPMPIFLFTNIQTMHIESNKYNTIAMLSLKTLYSVDLNPGLLVP
jgi:hypothetical protein